MVSPQQEVAAGAQQLSAALAVSAIPPYRARTISLIWMSSMTFSTCWDYAYRAQHAMAAGCAMSSTDT
jgi:hypothetical protein